MKKPVSKVIFYTFAIVIGFSWVIGTALLLNAIIPGHNPIKPLAAITSGFVFGVLAGKVKNNLEENNRI
ncbi:MAG: hypothetical protein K6B70_02745 [Clostridia bacterium]|nr:hypothetical protein [Clostridia bacterium]